MTPANALVGSLSDEDLCDLYTAAIEEQKRRLRDNIKKNKYSHPTELEMFVFNRGEQLKGIAAYKNRTNTTLFVARKIMEYYCLGIEP